MESQRLLRACLLDTRHISSRPARDLAAHMLLNIDNLDNCWSLATDWMRERLRCSRVDTGFGTPGAAEYFPSYAESKSMNYQVPTLGGSPVDNRDTAMQAMWYAQRPLVFEDVKQDRRIESGLRQRLSKAETKSKFAAPLRVGERRFGLICADWTKAHVPWKADLYDQFSETVSEVLSPIVFVAHEIDRHGRQRPGVPSRAKGVDRSAQDIPHSAAMRELQRLTTAEREVAQLVSHGMSYKEIANTRNKSLSTIDHQLRSIRGKLGVSSTRELISLLSQNAICKT